MQRVEECIKRLLREGDLSTLSLESVHAAVGLEMGTQWVVDHQQQVDDMVDSLLLMQSDAGSNNNSSSSSSDDSDIDSSTSSVQSSGQVGCCMHGGWGVVHAWPMELAHTQKHMHALAGWHMDSYLPTWSHGQTCTLPQ